MVTDLELGWHNNDWKRDIELIQELVDYKLYYSHHSEYLVVGFGVWCN
jgi:hypothetical protein